MAHNEEQRNDTSTKIKAEKMIQNTIVDKLARTIERVELGKGGAVKLPFIYADLDVQNVRLDNMQPPFAAATPIESAVVVSERGRYQEQATFEVFFGDMMAHPMSDYCAIENERIIDACKQRAFQWLASLVDNKELQLVSVNSMQHVVLQFDSVATGVLVSVTLKEIETYGICDLGTIR